MAAQQPPYALQSASHSAELFRRAVSAGLGSGGIVSPGDLAVSAPGGMSVAVAAGQVWMPNTLGSSAGMPSGLTSGGVYYGFNDGSVTLAIAAANATNPRIDLVVASVADSFYSGASNTWTLQVVTGTPSSSPAVPAAPANSIPVCQVLVPAGATSIVSGDLTDARPLASLLGGLTARGNPAGRICAGNTPNFAGTMANVGIGSSGTINATFLRGGMTYAPASTTNIGLIVPVSGYYQVNGQIYTVSGASGQNTVCGVNCPETGAVAIGTSIWSSSNSQGLFATVSDILYVTAGSHIYLQGQSSTTGGSAAAGNVNYLSAALESV